MVLDRSLPRPLLCFFFSSDAFPPVLPLPVATSPTSIPYAVALQIVLLWAELAEFAVQSVSCEEPFGADAEAGGGGGGGVARPSGGTMATLSNSMVAFRDGLSGEIELTREVRFLVLSIRDRSDFSSCICMRRKEGSSASAELATMALEIYRSCLPPYASNELRIKRGRQVVFMAPRLSIPAGEDHRSKRKLTDASTVA